LLGRHEALHEASPLSVRRGRSAGVTKFHPQSAEFVTREINCRRRKCSKPFLVERGGGGQSPAQVRDYVPAKV